MGGQEVTAIANALIERTGVSVVTLGCQSDQLSSAAIQQIAGPHVHA